MDAQVARVDDHGIVSGSHGRRRPARIGGVPRLERLTDLIDGLLCRLGITSAPCGSDLGSCRQEHLDRCVGEHHGSDVPSFHDRSTVVFCYPRTLQLHDRLPDAGMRRYSAHGIGDSGRPYFGGDGFTVEEDPPFVVVDGVFGESLQDGRLVVGIDTVPESHDRRRAIRRPGVEIGEAQAFGHGA